MSNEEHIVENIICWVQNIGWKNIPEQNTDEWQIAYNSICENSDVSQEIFSWLLEMAKYVVYQATVWGDDFSEDNNE
jgi:hypothetical protein